MSNVVTDNTLWVLVGIQVFLSILLICVSGKTLAPLSKHLKQRGDDDAMIHFNVITIGTLLWPIIWYLTIGFTSIKTCSVLLIAFLFPILLGVFQLYDIYYDKCEDIQDHQQQRTSLIGGIQTDNATIISFAFAMGALFFILKDRENLYPSIKMVIIALIICIALIVPTQNFVDNNQRYTTYIRVAQRIFMNYALGFILAALLILLANCTP